MKTIESKMTCNVCNLSSSKYKCPLCRIPYCSIPCWKTHKSGGCVKEQVISSPEVISTKCSGVEKDPQKPTYNFPTEDSVSPDKLKLLGENEQLKNILCNPHVRDILSSLDKSENPRKLLQDAMQEPIFLEFVDECMRTINPPSKQELDEAMMQS